MPYEIAPTSSFATDEHVQEHLEGLLEDGHDEDEMKESVSYTHLRAHRDRQKSRMPSSA